MFICLSIFLSESKQVFLCTLPSLFGCHPGQAQPQKAKGQIETLEQTKDAGHALRNYQELSSLDYVGKAPHHSRVAVPAVLIPRRPGCSSQAESVKFVQIRLSAKSCCKIQPAGDG